MSRLPRVLITGSRGFIGSSLTENLRAAGYEVWEITRSHPHEEYAVSADLLDPQQTYNAFRKIPCCPVVLHAAALAHGQNPPAGESCFSANTKITRNILAALDQQHTAHFIFLSSVAVYGEDRRHKAVSVHDDTFPATEYGKSKLQSENDLLQSSIESLDILRLAPVFDSEHLSDVRKRVFLPGSSFIKMKMYPPPQYSLCHIKTILETVSNLLVNLHDKKKVRNLSDRKAYSQNEIRAWFSGREIPFPVLLASPCYVVMRLAGVRGYALRCLYWKLCKSNIYLNNMKEL